MHRAGYRGFADREDRGDGLDLRTLTFAGEEVSSRVYFAVRDEWWRTVPLSIVRRSRKVTRSGFVVEVDAISAWDSHPFSVRIRYAAAGSGLEASFEAVARGDFTYCRIGFCVLYPVSFVGLDATSWRHGEPMSLRFPSAVVTRDARDEAALRFHRAFERLEAVLPSGTRVRYSFEGEQFEFEDQRNWTDPSYKAYSCPPPGGWPASTVDGDRYAQRMRITAYPGVHNVPAEPVDAAVRLGGTLGVVPPVDLFRGRLSPDSFRPGGGFQHLNSRRPELAGFDSIELAVNGAVHAADDDSVMETTAMHGALVAQARAMYPGLPVRLAPVSFLDSAGDWRDEGGHYAPEPPAGGFAPRHLTPFAATWTLASAAHAIPAGVDVLGYFDATLPADSPAGQAVARLRSLAGQDVLAVRAPEPLAVLAVSVAGGITLAVANPSSDRAEFVLPDGRPMSLDGFAHAWYSLPVRHGATSVLVAGSDPFSYQGLADLAKPGVRPDGEGGRDR